MKLHYSLLIETKKIMKLSLLPNKPELGLLHEADKGLDFGTIRHLFLDLVKCIEKRGIAAEHKTIGIGNVLEHLLIRTMLTADEGIDSAILSPFGTDDIGRYVLREGTTGLYHCTSSHTRLGIGNNTGREDDEVVNLTVASNLRTIAEDTTITHFRVMRNVCTLHQHIVVTDDGLPTAMGGTIYHHILTDDVIIANDTL